MKHNFYDSWELDFLCFKALGDNVLISRKASIYGADNIEIGSNVRIDDFCLLSGKIKIGDFVHIGAYASLCGGEAGITLEDYVSVSRKVEILAASDDYSGTAMTNPTIPNEYRNVQGAEVVLKKHAIIGVGSVVMPGVTLGEGSAVGALSFVKNDTDNWSINTGIPARFIKERKKDLLELEQLLYLKTHAEFNRCILH